MAQAVKNLPAMQETWVQSLGQEDPLEKGMATHLPGVFHGQRSLAGYSPWGHKESGMTEQLSMRAYPYVVSPIASSSILLAGSIIQCHWTTVTSFVK